MAKVTLPPGYCSACVTKTMNRVDLETEAEEKLESLKKKMLVAFMIGDRDGALAEISYQLGVTPGELSVSGPWESPAMTRDMARAIAAEIFFKFPDILEDLFYREGIYQRMRAKEERNRQDMEYMTNRMRNSYKPDPFMAKFGKDDYDAITPAKREYYIPPYSVKKNER